MNKHVNLFAVATQITSQRVKTSRVERLENGNGGYIVFDVETGEILGESDIGCAKFNVVDFSGWWWDWVLYGLVWGMVWFVCWFSGL